MLTERVNEALGNTALGQARTGAASRSNHCTNDASVSPRHLDRAGQRRSRRNARRRRLWRRRQRHAGQHRFAARELHLPNLAQLGLGNLKPLAHVGPVDRPTAAFGRCALASPGKDTTTGHWEMVGIHLAKPFPLFPHGFPPEIMQEFERRIGRGTLGNCAASGTEIIQANSARNTCAPASRSSTRRPTAFFKWPRMKK